MNTKGSIPIEKANFQSIIWFYLFECPVRTRKRKKNKLKVQGSSIPQPKYNYEYVRVCQRGKSFADRGLTGGNLNALRAAMKRVVSSETRVETVEEDVSSYSCSGEHLIVHKNEDNISDTEGLFYCIRNAFAHGSFEVIGDTYYFENYSDGVLVGKGMLKESTLLMWKNLVDMSIEDIKMAGKPVRKKAERKKSA